jgi:hypothetical protein
MFTLLTLPKVFPNLKHFTWNSYSSLKFGTSTELDKWQAPPNGTYIEAFKSWNRLQHIELRLSSKGFPVELYVLRAADLSDLTVLDIHLAIAQQDRSFPPNPEKQAKQILEKVLVRSIGDAPALRNLSLQNCIGFDGYGILTQ